MIFARVLKLCPKEERDSALFDLIATSRLLVNQVLARTPEGRRTPLREFLVVDEALREELFAVAEPERITQVIRGMVDRQGVSMTMAANQAYDEGLINESERAKYAREKMKYGS